jgi:hypothetical protein
MMKLTLLTREENQSRNQKHSKTGEIADILQTSNKFKNKMMKMKKRKIRVVYFQCFVDVFHQISLRNHNNQI